jgi:hypothetical protein
VGEKSQTAIKLVKIRRIADKKDKLQSFLPRKLD